MNETYVTFIGRVASDVRFATTEGGVAVASFRAASTPRRYAQGNWTDGHTSYVTVKCWRGLADHVHDSLDKGQPVVVHGRQTVRPWRLEDGRTGTSVDIDADAVGHDLRWGTSKFTKTTRVAEARDGLDAVAADLASSFDTEDIEPGESEESPFEPGETELRTGADGWAVPGASAAA